MNVNKELLELKKILNCPVAQDVYDGKENRWIVFTYADERGVYFGDDEEEMTRVYINLSYYTPIAYNYFEDKKNIKKSLMKNGFFIEYIKSWVEDLDIGIEKIRHTVFVISKMDKDE